MAVEKKSTYLLIQIALLTLSSLYVSSAFQQIPPSIFSSQNTLIKASSWKFYAKGASNRRSKEASNSPSASAKKIVDPFAVLMDDTRGSDRGNSNNRSDESNSGKRRKKKNKYAKFSKTGAQELDPLEQLMVDSQQKNKQLENEIAEKKNKRVELDADAIEALKHEKRDRDKREFPDNKTIDPYDPTTYGYVELGTILGPHGVHGLCKIASVTDFPERLCKPGIRHLKALNRRSPREIQLLEGRHRLKNEYLVKFDQVSDRNDAMKLRGTILYARQEERPEDIEEDEYLVTDLVGLDVRLVTGYAEHVDDEEDDDDEVGIVDINNVAYDGSNMPITEDDIDEDGREDLDEEESSLGGKFVGIVSGVVLAEEMCTIPGLGQDLLEIRLPRGQHGTPSWKDELVLIPLVPSIVTTVDIERQLMYIDPPAGLLDLTYVKEDNVRIKGFLPEKSSYEKNIQV